MRATIDVSSTRNCHCLAARKHAREITRLFDSKLRPHGLRATQLAVLAALAIKGPTPITSLASVLGLERTSLTRIGAVLERNGWLAAEAAGEGRRKFLALSSSGRKKLNEALPAWQEAQEIAERRMASQTLSAR